MPSRITSKNPSCWKDDDFRIFISHLSKNKAEAQQLSESLAKFGISGFVAHEDIEPSQEWQEEIEVALKACDAFIAMLVPRFHTSRWTDHEVGFAVCRNVPVFPANMGKMPYGFMQKYQAVPFQNVQKLAEAVFNRLLKNSKTQMKLSNTVLNYISDSPSFVEANERSKLILHKNFGRDEKLIQRLRQIVEKKRQVREATTASSRIHRVVGEFEDEIKQKKVTTLAEIFSGHWVNNYHHHSGRRKSEKVEINGNKYYADDNLVFKIDQVKISDDAKKVQFQKTHLITGYKSTVDLTLISPYVYSGSEKGTDGVSTIQYKKVS